MDGAADDEDISELTDAVFARAELMRNGKPLRRGRPAPNGAKDWITLRLHPAVIEGCRATGPGWQARMNDARRDWLGRPAA